MKQQTNLTLLGGIITAGIVILSSFETATRTHSIGLLVENHTTATPQSEALEVLRHKCNVCHRKQNPFMVFNERNMVKRAKRINRAVFIQKRMPKGDLVKLSNDEYDILKAWLNQISIKQ